MNVFLSISLLGAVFLPDFCCDKVDVCELNHYYNENGDIKFVQWVWWEWDDCSLRHQVIDWRFSKEGESVLSNDLLIFFDDSNKVIRKIKFSTFRKTWTQNDPEVDDRFIHPTNKRRRLIDVR